MLFRSKVFSQQLVYTSLEQQGIKPKEEGPKHNSKRGNAKIESTLRDVQPFAIDVKGGGKESKTRSRECVSINAKGGGC